MTLFHQTLGQGCPLLAIHGWGFNSAVWQEVQASLAPEYSVTTLDLPGYGRSPALDHDGTLRTWAKLAAELVTLPAVWMGWSLGGLIALKAARIVPEKVRALVVVASSPRFVRSEDWRYGIPESLLRHFTLALEHNYRSTLDRFLMLQAGQGEHTKVVVRRLRQGLSQHGLPRRQALREGLEVLRVADLRADLAEIRCPTLVVLGARDTLVPACVGQAMAGLHPGWQVVVIPKSGHIPFLSHPQKFLASLSVFLNEVC
jgi:pimeloyl-[acyl-carrier protein] methyl ester esterase